MKIPKVFKCLGCKKCTFTIREYYMVEDSIWKESGMDEGMLCIGCLEDRLGRPLTPPDFIDARINRGEFPYSRRLFNRLTGL